MKKLIVFLVIASILTFVFASCEFGTTVPSTPDNPNGNDPTIDLSKLTYEDSVQYVIGAYQLSNPTKVTTTTTSKLAETSGELTSTEVRILQKNGNDTEMKYVLTKENYSSIVITDTGISNEGGKIQTTTTSYFKKSESPDASFKLTPILTGYLEDNFEKTSFTENGETVTFTLTVQLEKANEVFNLDTQKEYKKATITVTLNKATNRVESSTFELKFQGQPFKSSTDVITITNVYSYNNESFTYGE